MNRQRTLFLVTENAASCPAYRNMKTRLSRSLGKEEHVDQ